MPCNKYDCKNVVNCTYWTDRFKIFHIVIINFQKSTVWAKNKIQDIYCVIKQANSIISKERVMTCYNNWNWIITDKIGQNKSSVVHYSWVFRCKIVDVFLIISDSIELENIHYRFRIIHRLYQMFIWRSLWMVELIMC